MLKKIDRLLGWLLALGGVLHGYGAFTAYEFLTPVLVWSLAGSLAALLLAAINLMRVERPQDRTLAWVGFAGSLGWLSVVLAFGASINKPFDPRVLYHLIAAAALAAFSLRTALGRA
jgi:peptidoglycan/LPS O-acetylase OafA/YrhL